MSAPSCFPISPTHAPILHRDYDDGHGRFELSVDRAMNTTVTVAGKGTMKGVKAMLACLDEAVAKFEPGRASKVYVDMSASEGGPLRGQLLFGKWLLRHNKRIQRGVIVGAPKGERRMASGAMRVARLQNVRFFDDPKPARSWLSEG